MVRRTLGSRLFPYTTLFRSQYDEFGYPVLWKQPRGGETEYHWNNAGQLTSIVDALEHAESYTYDASGNRRSEEHTSELQSHVNIVCRLLLEKKNDSYPKITV